MNYQIHIQNYIYSRLYESIKGDGKKEEGCGKLLDSMRERERERENKVVKIIA